MSERTTLEADWTDSESPTAAILDVVSDAEGTEPTALPPIYECVDADAVDRLVDHAASEADRDLWLTFEYCSYVVTVDSDGEVVVSWREEGSGASE